MGKHKVPSPPKVGDRLMLVPIARAYHGETHAPQLCEVVMVHTKHLWYQVRFSDSGLLECYKYVA